MVYLANKIWVRILLLAYCTYKYSLEIVYSCPDVISLSSTKWTLLARATFMIYSSGMVIPGRADHVYLGDRLELSFRGRAQADVFF